MQYTNKFQAMADAARARVQSVQASDVDSLMADGAIALDIRDPDEHAAGHISGSQNLSRGKLEMLVEGRIPELDTKIMCYCNANNRGALSAAALVDMGYINATYIEGGLNAYKALSA
ncbi:MAG: rhodanese-like domain-containing protein [Gammaproteobacteria bacterium]|nr:rhodanese-like domain-containing protein [Gammaproteobacteria bacterium]